MKSYKHITVINGPNLNLLGIRQPEIYGIVTLDDINKKCSKIIEGSDWKLEFKQSNSEAEIIDFIHQSIKAEDKGIIINAGAYSHTSIAILDALNMFPNIIIEVHLSNIFSREEYRHHSWISKGADCVLCGFGTEGYVIAVQHFLK